MSKILLVGQAPAKQGDPARPLLDVRSAMRLQELCGLTPEEYEHAFDRINLLPSWPGRYGKGDTFDLAAARQAVVDMTPSLEGRRLILLGSNVARAFMVPYPPLLTWRSGRLHYWGDLVQDRMQEISYTYAVVPHPSGVNRWWNDPGNVDSARRFLRTGL